MTGTPSRTATAARRRVVGRKPYAKLRPEGHEPQPRRHAGLSVTRQAKTVPRGGAAASSRPRRLSGSSHLTPRRRLRRPPRHAATPRRRRFRFPHKFALAHSLALIKHVMRRENLLAAHARVVRNAGAPGVDGMTVDDLMPYCRTHWARIREQLLNGTYVPHPCDGSTSRSRTAGARGR